MTGNRQIFNRQKTARVASEPTAQYVLLIALVFISIGNIAIPGRVPIVSAVYLPFSVVVVSLIVLHSLGRLIDSLKSSLLLLLLLLSFLPGFFANELNPYGRTKLISLILAALLLIAPALIKNWKASINFLSIVLFVVSAVTSILLLLFGEPDVADRSTLMGINPISTARVVGIGIVISIYWILNTDRNRKWVWISLFISIFCLLALIATGSRGPFLSTILGVTVVMLISFKRRPRRSSGVLFSLVLISIFAFRWLNFEDDARITSTDSNGRDRLYTASIESMLTHPEGVGWGNFHQVLPAVQGVNSYTLYSHNILLEVGVEGGWLALLFFVFLVFVALSRSLKVGWQGNAYAAFVSSMLVYSLTNAMFSSDLVGNRMVWLFIGLSIAITGQSMVMKSKSYKLLAKEETKVVNV